MAKRGTVAVNGQDRALLNMQVALDMFNKKFAEGIDATASRHELADCELRFLLSEDGVRYLARIGNIEVEAPTVDDVTAELQSRIASAPTPGTRAWRWQRGLSWRR